MNKQKQIYYCKDCKIKQIHWSTALYREGRCRSCARIYQYAIKPETNPMYIDGRTNVKVYCMDCGKKLSRCANVVGYKRCQSCAKKGNLHWNWLEGKTKNGYTVDFNKELKLEILKRDNFECQICKKTNKEYLYQFGVNLTIHHIDYDKQHCQENNLITLCNSCHMKTNFNREKWIMYFKNESVKC